MMLTCYWLEASGNGSLEHTGFSWLLRLSLLSCFLIGFWGVSRAIGIIRTKGGSLSDPSNAQTISDSGKSKTKWWRNFAVIDLFLSLREMRKTSEAEAYREMRQHLMSHINHDKRGFSRPASVLMTYLLVCMAIGWGTMAIHDHIVIQRLQEELAIPPGVIKMHGLKVTQRSGPRHFEALVKDPFDAEWSKFHANVCPGSTITNEIQAGVTLTLWQYVEDPLRNCMDLSNQRITGYSLERNPDGTPVIDILTAISVSGQAASPRTSASTAR